MLIDGRHANVNLALSKNNKDQVIDSNNYFNQKVITVLNALDGSTLGDNLVTSHQNDQDYLVAIPKVGSNVISLVANCLCLRNYSYVWIQYFLKTKYCVLLTVSSYISLEKNFVYLIACVRFSFLTVFMYIAEK